MEIIHFKIVSALRMEIIEDIYGRSFKTLRVSLLNTCNLACSYCVDPNQKESLKYNNKKERKSLSTNEFITIIKALHQILNFETVRFTGGEPTLYKDLLNLTMGVAQLGIPQIKMTTNGVTLQKNAKLLKEAGLSSINVSLDALDEDIAFKISKRHKITQVLAGVDAALEVGIKLKLNCVVIRGENDSQIIDLLDYAIKNQISIRYLELMQMGHLYHNFEQNFFSEAEILEVISKKYAYKSIQRADFSTTKYFELGNGFQFGIISNVSDPFCNDCNRLRLDSYGDIYGCLSENEPINILENLHNQTQLSAKLHQALGQKKTHFLGSQLSMLDIGG